MSEFVAISKGGLCTLTVERRSKEGEVSVKLAYLGSIGREIAVFRDETLKAAGIHITLEKPFPAGDGAVIEIAGRKYARLQSEASDPVPWVDSDANPWSEDELRAFEAEKGAQRIVHFPGVAA